MIWLFALAFGVNARAAEVTQKTDDVVLRQEGMEVIRNDDKIILRLDGAGAYGFGSVEPTDSEKALLLHAVALLSKYHYDRYPIRISGYSGNPELSDERARWIKALMVRQGLSSDDILTEGHGPNPSLIDERGIEITVARRRELNLDAAGKAKAKTLADFLPEFSGYWLQENAYQVRAPDGLSEAMNAVQLAAAGRINDNVSYKLSGRGIYDAAYALTNRYSAAVNNDMRSELSVRDAFIDASFDNDDFRVGSQQIVWGESVGIFTADVVNARDLREFILPDFEFIRTPKWAMDYEHDWGGVHSELVWSPILQFDNINVPGAPFSPAIPLPARTPAVFNGTITPANTLANSESGIRLSYLIGGWDISAYEYYGWDHDPVLFRTIVPGGVYVFTPAYERLPISGATFSKDLGAFVMHGEGIYSQGKYLPTLSVSSPDGVVRKDTIDATLGLSRSYFEHVDISAQFIERDVLDYGSVPIFQEYPETHRFSLWMKGHFLDHHLEPEFTVISTIGHSDLMLNPRLNVNWGGDWAIAFGANIFEGNENGLFGQFAGSSRVYSELRYQFEFNPRRPN